MRQVLKGKRAEWYARNYYSVEDDVIAVFEHMDTPFLDTLLKPKMKVFDAMMGRGRHALRYAQRGCVVQGNDLNPHMVALARKTAKSAKIKISLSQLDVCELKGVPSNSFDATIAMFSALGIIPKTKRRQQAIAAMARVTKPGGVVIIHAHNRLDTFFRRGFIGWALKTTFAPSKGLETGDIVTNYNGLKNMFNHLYTPQEFRRSFERAGLKVVDERYMDYGRRRFITGSLKKIKADGFIFVGAKR